MNLGGKLAYKDFEGPFLLDRPFRWDSFNLLPYAKNLVLVIEDDSHISRLVRTHFEQAFQGVRVEIAGSPSKAKMICEKFKPQVIVWDGQPNERGTREEYAACIPDNLWSRVIPISSQAENQEWAQGKGARAGLPKPKESFNAWAEQLIGLAKPLLLPAKASRR